MPVKMIIWDGKKVPEEGQVALHRHGAPGYCTISVPTLMTRDRGSYRHCLRPEGRYTGKEYRQQRHTRPSAGAALFVSR